MRDSSYHLFKRIEDFKQDRSFYNSLNKKQISQLEILFRKVFSFRYIILEIGRICSTFDLKEEDYFEWDSALHACFNVLEEWNSMQIEIEDKIKSKSLDTDFTFLYESRHERINLDWNEYFCPEGNTITADENREEVFRVDINYSMSAFMNSYVGLLALNNSLRSDQGLINDIEKNTIEASKLLGEIQAKVKFAESIHEKAVKVDVELSIDAADAVTQRYSSIFSRQAGNHGSVATNWLIAGVVLIFILAIGIALGHVFIPISNDVGELDFQNLVTKIFMVSLLVYAATFSFRQYSANKHQEAVNIHRANAMNSYSLFSSAIPDEQQESRNQLLVQLAKSIYENTQSTGFLQDKGATGSTIFDFKSIIDAGSKKS